MKTRTLVPKTPLAVAGRAAWVRLAQAALSAAVRRGDPRATAIQAALDSGNPEPGLRKLSVICESDVSREFPSNPVQK